MTQKKPKAAASADPHSKITAEPYVTRGGPEGLYYAFILINGTHRKIGYSYSTEEEAMQVAKNAAMSAPHTG